jgi:hypothetical protein
MGAQALKPSKAALLGVLVAALTLLGLPGCASATVGAGWGTSVPAEPYGPYNGVGSPVVGVYGRP